MSAVIQSRRAVRQNRFDCYYIETGRIGDSCRYCGVVSCGYDHIPPIAHIERLSDVTDIDQINCRKVPCCKQCNLILGAVLLLTVPERRSHVRTSLRKKYRALLRMPYWDEEELAELDNDLANQIRQWSSFAEYIKKRLGYQGG